MFVFLLYIVHTEVGSVIILSIFKTISLPCWNVTTILVADLYPTALRYFNVYVSGYDNVYISGYDNVYVSGYDNVYVSGYDNVYVSGYDNIYISGY